MAVGVLFSPPNTRITLRSRQQTGADCYRTSADDRNTTSGSTEMNIWPRRSPGIPSRGFRIVDLRVQTAVFAVSVKPEVVVSGLELVLRDRKWLPPAEILWYSDCNHAPCEGIFCFDSVSITFVHIASAHAYRDQAFLTTVTSNISPCAMGLLSCLSCVSVTLVYCG